MLFFIFLSFCLCLYFSICSVYLSVYMCLSFSFCLSFSLCLSFCLCLFLCLCLSYSFSFCFCFSSLWQNTAVAFLQFLFLLNLPFYKYKKKSIFGKPKNRILWNNFIKCWQARLVWVSWSLIFLVHLFSFLPFVEEKKKVFVKSGRPARPVCDFSSS